MRYADIFSGTGGFRMGLEDSNHECVYTVEYNEKAHIAHDALWDDHNNTKWYDDVQLLDAHTIPDIDILVGGFPCAHFSMAGDREGFQSADPRGQMFFELMKIASIKKPKYLFFENVKGLLSHDEGRSFGRILREMDEHGYDAEWQLVNAKDFGYPVLRERVFIIGHLRGEGTEKVFPITGGGGTNEDTTPIFQFRRGYFRRFKGYCPTLTASMGTGGNNVPMVIQNNALRKMTPREIFRLQGFPEHYIDKLVNSGLPDSALYERAGRSVFVPVIKEIAKRLK